MSVAECMADPRVLSGEMWARPVGARMHAYTVRDNRVELVPGLRGGTSRLSFAPAELSGPWELVDPDAVVAEGGLGPAEGEP